MNDGHHLSFHRVQLDKRDRQENEDRQPRPHLRHDFVEDDLCGEYFADERRDETRPVTAKLIVTADFIDFGSRQTRSGRLIMSMIRLMSGSVMRKCF